jgi:hypothetical protein
MTAWGVEDTASDLTFFSVINRAQYFGTLRGKLVEFSSVIVNIKQPAPMDGRGNRAAAETGVPCLNESDRSNKCWS